MALTDCRALLKATSVVEVPGPRWARANTRDVMASTVWVLRLPLRELAALASTVRTWGEDTTRCVDSAVLADMDTSSLRRHTMGPQNTEGHDTK